ncbi:MAG TPA: tetratricopeptide repeat protein [Euzebya sp.]|nr:tetratricopeptide repeat protein [Euzebya sp.]
MRTIAAATAEGKGSRPSPRWAMAPRWVTALSAAAAAALLGLALGSFLTYSDTPTVPLPTVVVPPDDAVRALQADAQAAPEDPRRWQLLAVAATQQAIATADPVWYAVAGNAFDRALTLDPDNAFTEVARGQLLLSLHDFHDALLLGQEVTEALPATADAWGVLVDAQVELGRYDQAAESLQTMLDLRPDLPALARAAYLRQLHGDLDGAILAMRQADLAAAGVSADASAVAGLLGDLLLQRGDLEQAEHAYRRASTASAAAGLARIAAARGDLDRAEMILLELSRRSPVPAVLTALAEVQARLNDTDGLARTVQLARSLATLQQDAGQVVDLELALFEASFGDPGRAVELAEAAYAARPDNVYAAGALAWALHRTGQGDRARQLAVQATRLGTVDTPHELRMAAITGDGIEALRDRNPNAWELYLP